MSKQDPHDSQINAKNEEMLSNHNSMMMPKIHTFNKPNYQDSGVITSGEDKPLNPILIEIDQIE